jgi:bacterioferritin (cytochrome b1)
MPFSNAWSKWWRGFFQAAPVREPAAMEILRQRYVEEMQAVDRFKQHALKMRYPQFRDKLLQIATDKSKHAEWIVEKLIALGGKLPEVAAHLSTDESSWRYLQMDLVEENRCADRLPGQIWRIESDHPEISQFLQGIFQAEKKHREEINDMMMRSDGLARSLA